MIDEKKKKIARVQYDIARLVRDTVITFQQYGIPYTEENIEKFIGMLTDKVQLWIEIEKEVDGRESTPEDLWIQGPVPRGN